MNAHKMNVITNYLLYCIRKTNDIKQRKDNIKNGRRKFVTIVAVSIYAA